MTLNIVEIPYSYFPDFNRNRPLFNASIYVGLVDTDPEIPANQKQVTVRQENGTEIEIAQPILTGSGGVPTYNGSPVTVLVDGADPRDLSPDVLNEAFQVQEGDTAEFTYTADIDVALSPKRGDVFKVVADVTIKEAQGLVPESRRVLQQLILTLEILDQVFTEIGQNAPDAEDVICFASLNGLCAGLRTQLELIAMVLATRPKKNC